MMRSTLSKGYHEEHDEIIIVPSVVVSYVQNCTPKTLYEVVYLTDPIR